MSQHKIISTERGRDLFSELKDSSSTEHSSRSKNNSVGLRFQPDTKFKRSFRMPLMASSLSLDSFNLKQQLINIYKENPLPTARKHQQQNMRFLNSQLLNEMTDQNSQRPNNFIIGRANIISKKFLQSLEKVQTFVRLQEQRNSNTHRRIEKNSKNTIQQGKNYLNRIVHRHKQEQTRYKKMIENLAKRVNINKSKTDKKFAEQLLTEQGLQKGKGSSR